jgi:hypothetical protein
MLGLRSAVRPLCSSRLAIGHAGERSPIIAATDRGQYVCHSSILPGGSTGQCHGRGTADAGGSAGRQSAPGDQAG